MGCRKDMENTVGLMGHCTKEILSKELEMDMDFGEAEKELIKHTKDIICLIKNMDMELFNMLMVTNMKVIGKMVKDQDKEYINIRMEIYMKVNGFRI